jgi:probable phosphoglycerate mutase
VSGSTRTPGSSRLFAVRHGQSEWNAQRRWQGRADVELTEEGERQALRAADLLGTFHVIASSSLRRARRTAELIAARHGIDEVVVDDRLCECDVGPWQGLTYAQIEERWPGWVRAGRQPEGFEPNDAVVARMSEAFRDLVGRSGGEDVLVVSHSGAIRTLRRALRVHDERLENLGGSWFHLGPDGAVAAGELVQVLGAVDSAETL